MFEYDEPLTPRFLNVLPEELRINSTSVSEAVLIRLITGTINVYHIPTDYSFKPRNNYSNLSFTRNVRVSSKPIKDCFDVSSLNQIADYIKENDTKNKKYNESLLTELTHFFYCKSKKNYLSSFVHLYRFLEFISYSFPLIHASNTKNYYGSFDSLKKYFKGDGAELKFLIRFTNDLFDSRPELSLVAEFNVPGTSTAQREKLYKSIKHILRDKNYLVFDDTLFQFKTEYKNLIDLIVYIRNRYFHFATGGMKNIKTSDILDPNVFFGLIVDNAVNWLACIYVEIIRQQGSE